MIDSLERMLQHYEISHYGFLPVDEPLALLPDTYYAPWESVMARLPMLIASGQYHNIITNMPVLETSRLKLTPEWRRAYVILSFLTHAHIWSGQTPQEVLPPNIARPLLEVSEHLGLPPTATYPALNLWNCGLVAGADITNPENVVIRHTFTGTDDERWFYGVSVSVEAKGVRAIELMMECIEAIETSDDLRVEECLRSFSELVAQLGKLLRRMNERCDPHVFFHRIRPFLAGSRGMEKAGLPRGVFYDEDGGEGSWRQYSGGSNAQSTLIQFLDISLGVKHAATGSKNQDQALAKKHTYLDEMRKYMPVSHREFLEHFTSIVNIREYATSPEAAPSVRQAFESAVDALTAFRDIHISIVARYIVLPSRSGKPDSSSTTKNIALASSNTSKREDLKGTGGTYLMEFLKQVRDETKAAREPIATST